MTNSRDDQVLEVLREIHRLLVPISACFEDRHKEVIKQQSETKFKELEPLLTDQRRLIFPLLFDSRHLSQVQIAEEANTTQPTVSRFISALLEQDLIDQGKDETGTVVYKDKFNLAKRMQEVKSTC